MKHHQLCIHICLQINNISNINNPRKAGARVSREEMTSPCINKVVVEVREEEGEVVAEEAAVEEEEEISSINTNINSISPTGEVVETEEEEEVVGQGGRGEEEVVVVEVRIGKSLQNRRQSLERIQMSTLMAVHGWPNDVLSSNNSKRNTIRRGQRRRSNRKRKSVNDARVSYKL